MTQKTTAKTAGARVAAPKKTSGAKKRGGEPRVRLWLAALTAAAILMYLSGGVGVRRGSRGTQSEVAGSRARLQALEAQEPVDLEAEYRRQRKALLKQRNGILVDDLEAEQQKILAMTDEDWNYADLARWFEHAAIVGDSIIRQVRLYDFLDAPVFAEGGIHISVDLPLLDEVEAARPSVVFLCFGMNDVGVFQEKIDLYVSRYSNIIRRLQISLPDAAIYVHAALPVSDKLMKEEPKYRWLEPYNRAMEQVCPELGAYFIDSSFLVEGRPEVFREDGVHPREEYYPMWLTYLADIAGLSDG